MNNILNQLILGNTVKVWLIAIGIIAGSLLVARLIKTLVLTRIQKLSLRTRTTIDDLLVTLIKRSFIPFLYVIAFYGGLQYLWIDSRIQRVLHVALLAVSIFFIIRVITDIIRYLFQRVMEKNSDQQSQVKQARGILVIINILVWIIGFLFLIDNLGYNITTIITGLGIGGIAIALAAQQY